MSVFIAVAVVVAHAPMLGGTQGGACVGKPWESCFIQTGEAACNRWPTGTRLDFPEWVTAYGIPAVIYCDGGGGPAVDVDLAFVSADPQTDYAMAMAWGRRRIEVQVTLPAGAGIAPPYAAHVERQAAEKASWRARRTRRNLQ